MIETAQRLVEGLGRVGADYHKLVLVVGPTGSGRAAAMRLAAERTGGRLLNLNLEVSRRLLEVPEARRALQFADAVDEVVGGEESPLFLHRIEMIFDPAFLQDPLRLLQRLSRTRVLVAAWTGAFDGTFLTYAAPGHPEHRRCSAEGVALVQAPTMEDL